MHKLLEKEDEEVNLQSSKLLESSNLMEVANVGVDEPKVIEKPLS